MLSRWWVIYFGGFPREPPPTHEMPVTNACSKCSAKGEKVSLMMCPICHKMVCEKCRVHKSGRSFCSQYCAEYFFFGDED